jgi:hypothetical protein
MFRPSCYVCCFTRRAGRHRHQYGYIPCALRPYARTVDSVSELNSRTLHVPASELQRASVMRRQTKNTPERLNPINRQLHHIEVPSIPHISCPSPKKWVGPVLSPLALST